MTRTEDGFRKALVVGWFSYRDMGATAGDLMARDLVCDWLGADGKAFDVATAPPFSGGIALDDAAPGDYSHVVFVCGPWGKGEVQLRLLERFANCAMIGVDVSMLEPLEAWNPFDHLIERDSSRGTRPDISFLARGPRVPVVGLLLVHRQTEYGATRARHDIADERLTRLTQSQEMAIVSIDTRLDANRTGLRTPAEVESLIARMDIVLTTRLHGLALAIKHGVPVVAVDPIAGGAKVSRQAAAIGWPLVFAAETVTDAQLNDAFTFCRSDAARALALECGRRATHLAQDIRRDFLTAVSQSPSRSI